MLYMPLRMASRPVADAARLGVQPTSVYIRVKSMPSSASVLMLGVSSPRTFWIAGMPTSPKAVSSHMMWMRFGGRPCFSRSSASLASSAWSSLAQRAPC